MIDEDEDDTEDIYDAVLACRKEAAIKEQKEFKRITFIFAWYDFWIGMFWDRRKDKLYIFPIPMFGIVIHKKEWKEYL